MLTSRIVSILALALALLLCASLISADEAPSTSPVRHVVIVWLKAPGDADARSRILEESKALEEIPGVLSVEGGVVLPSERAVVDSSFDLGLVITLESERALALYAGHPIHQELLAETLRPLVARYVVYDLLESP